MAGARIDMPVNGAADWSSFVDIVQHMMQPFMSVSLTHMDDALEPEIESVSAVIVKGTCYQFAADEGITDWAGIGNSTDVYIYIVPAGATCTAAWSDVAPTWDSDYQGYYDGNNRCIGGAWKNAAGGCANKYLYTPDVVQETIRAGSVRPFLRKVLELGNWNMDTTDAIDVATGVDRTKVRGILSLLIRRDDDVYIYPGTYGASYSDQALRYLLQGAQNINIARNAGSMWDGVGFQSSPFNRGWVTILYAP